MPHSFHQNLAHIVFSTKERRAHIDQEIEPRPHAYLGGIIREQGGIALEINGTTDHVPMLVKGPKTISDANFTRVVKTNSSRWPHQSFPRKVRFGWQVGYGWFTVSFLQLGLVRSYIRRQKEHHARRTIQEAFLPLLRKHGIEFDERYVLD